MIVWVGVILNRVVVETLNRRFNKLCGSHLQKTTFSLAFNGIVTLSRRVLNHTLCFKGANLMSCILTRRKKGLMNSDFCQVSHHYIQINENWLSYGAGHTVRITLSLCLFIDFI